MLYDKTHRAVVYGSVVKLVCGVVVVWDQQETRRAIWGDEKQYIQPQLQEGRRTLAMRTAITIPYRNNEPRLTFRIKRNKLSCIHHVPFSGQLDLSLLGFTFRNLSLSYSRFGFRDELFTGSAGEACTFTTVDFVGRVGGSPLEFDLRSGRYGERS